ELDTTIATLQKRLEQSQAKLQKSSHTEDAMKQFIALLSISSLIVLHAEDRRPDKSVLVIMTFNAEFLWDGVQPEDGDATFEWKGSQSEAEEHMSRIAAAIAQSNPDIVNLVEVENLQALTTVNNKFLPGRGYTPFLVDGTDTATGQDVALLTRIDPENSQIERDNRQGHAGGVSKGLSKNYIARFRVDTLQF